MAIKIFYVKSDAMAILVPGKHLWGFEKQKGTGAMSFIVGTHDELIKMYVNSSGHRFHHEFVMDDDHPVKLYFDIDGPADTSPEILDSLHKYVSDQIDGCDPPMILDASDKTKFSKHVIYSVAFKDKSILREFVNDLKSSIPVDDPLYVLIDFSVYDTDHSLRIVGSSKRNVGRPFMFEGRPMVSRLVLERSLIRFVHESDTMVQTWGNYDGPRQGVKRMRYSEQTPDWDGWGDGVLDNLVSKLCNYVKTRYKCKYTNIKWLGNILAVNLHPGIYCPKKKSKHKNNCSSVLCTIPVKYSDNMGIMVKVICMDLECQEDDNKYVIDRYNIPVIKKN